MSEPLVLRSPALDDSRLRHGFFTRVGGVSQGLQDGKRDDLALDFRPELPPQEVRENRARAAAAFGAPFVTAQQVHGASVLSVTDLWDAQTAPRQADGLVTDRKDLGLGILSADCAPILFADLEAAVIGACHAGWRGLQAGVIDATVQAMVALGARPAQMRAVLGPCLGRLSFEVSLDFPDEFATVLPRHRAYFRPAVRRDRLLFDMPRAVGSLCEAAGLPRLQVLDLDTYTQRDRFFSYRRATHAQDGDGGRQISLIALK